MNSNKSARTGDLRNQNHHARWHITRRCGKKYNKQSWNDRREQADRARDEVGSSGDTFDTLSDD